MRSFTKYNQKIRVKISFPIQYLFISNYLHQNIPALVILLTVSILGVIRTWFYELLKKSVRSNDYKVSVRLRDYAKLCVLLMSMPKDTLRYVTHRSCSIISHTSSILMATADVDTTLTKFIINSGIWQINY